jgi:2-dehydro-3-deoxyphosphogalactonate aldolase
MNDDLREWLARSPYIAILRGVQPEEVEDIAQALIDEGIVIIEVPLNSPRPLDSIRCLASRFSTGALIGAGTVLNVAAVQAVADAGARLVVMPNADADVVRAAKRAGLIALPGFLTPSEALAMLAAGADALKLFPAEMASPAVLKAVRAVLPASVGVLPVGGIQFQHVAAWRAAGAAGFGVGSALYSPGTSAADVRARAREFVASAG